MYGDYQRRVRGETGLMKCECQNVGRLMPMMASQYDPDTELPFVNHKAGECKCTNELKKYKKNGKIVHLCSCCVMGEEEVKDESSVNGASANTEEKS